MSTKLTLIAGTFALISVANFKNPLGNVVPPPPGLTSLVPADPSIATVGPAVGGFAVTAGAIGATTLAFTSGPVTASIDVEVLDPATPVSVDLTVGPLTAVTPAEVAETEPPVADSTAQADAAGTGV
jgi:hypothetical protein